MESQLWALIAAVIVSTVTANLAMVRWLLNSFHKQMRRVEKQQILTTSSLILFQQQLLAHDLTVSGLNPSTGATFEERDSKALGKYKEVQRGLEELRQEVLRSLG